MAMLWPYPPSVNRLYRKNPNGGMFKAKEWTVWADEVERYMRDQDALKFTGPVKVEYIVARPDNRRRDITNLIKCLDDMLELLGIVDNDCQIVDCHIYWDREDRVANGLLVTVEAA